LGGTESTFGAGVGLGSPTVEDQIPSQKHKKPVRTFEGRGLARCRVEWNWKKKGIAGEKGRFGLGGGKSYGSLKTEFEGFKNHGGGRKGGGEG